MSAIDAALTKSAKLFVETMFKNGRTSRLPRGLEQATSIDNPSHMGFLSRIRIRISLKDDENGAPWAAAYEYGSGEHSEKAPKPYRIAPKQAPFLAFGWQPETIPFNSPKFIGVKREPGEATKGVYFFKYIDHPGVEARPYIRPTINETKEEIRNILAKEAKAGLLAGTPRVTVIK